MRANLEVGRDVATVEAGGVEGEAVGDFRQGLSGGVKERHSEQL